MDSHFWGCRCIRQMVQNAFPGIPELLESSLFPYIASMLSTAFLFESGRVFYNTNTRKPVGWWIYTVSSFSIFSYFRGFFPGDFISRAVMLCFAGILSFRAISKERENCEYGLVNTLSVLSMSFCCFAFTGIDLSPLSRISIIEENQLFKTVSSVLVLLNTVSSVVMAWALWRYYYEKYLKRREILLLKSWQASFSVFLFLLSLPDGLSQKWLAEYLTATEKTASHENRGNIVQD